MRLDLTFTEHFTAPVQNVWLAITDRRMLALWLMESDFERWPIKLRALASRLGDER